MVDSTGSAVSWYRVDHVRRQVMRKAWLMVAGALLVAGPATATNKTVARGEAALAKTLAGRTAGKPVQCLSLQQVQGTQIYDGTAIVYRAGRDTLYVNRTQDARFLRDDDIPVVRVYGSQVCRLDTIRLLDRSTRFERGLAILGDFVPYAKPKKAAR
jgi:hypothetical protein